MSYLLDALEQAEKERDQHNAPDLCDDHQIAQPEGLKSDTDAGKSSASFTRAWLLVPTLLGIIAGAWYAGLPTVDNTASIPSFSGNQSATLEGEPDIVTEHFGHQADKTSNQADEISTKAPPASATNPENRIDTHAFTPETNSTGLPIARTSTNDEIIFRAPVLSGEELAAAGSTTKAPRQLSSPKGAPDAIPGAKTATSATPSTPSSSATTPVSEPTSATAPGVPAPGTSTNARPESMEHSKAYASAPIPTLRTGEPASRENRITKQTSAGDELSPETGSVTPGADARAHEINTAGRAERSQAALGAGREQVEQKQAEAAYIKHFRELPYEIQSELPDIQYSVHLYAPAPGQRMVVIDGSVRREGDSLKGGLKLEEITPAGAVFSFRGHTFRVPVSG